MTLREETEQTTMALGEEAEHGNGFRRRNKAMVIGLGEGTDPSNGVNGKDARFIN